MAASLTLMEYAAPLFNSDNTVRGAIGIFMDMTERRRVEQEQRFLAHASAFLSSSLDYETTLRALARLAVPMFGDYCAVDVLQEDGTFAGSTWWSTIRIGSEWGRRSSGIRQGSAWKDRPCGRSSRASRLSTTTPDRRRSRAAHRIPQHLDLLRRFGVRSFQMVPLRSRGRTLGLFTTGSFSGRLYTSTIWRWRRMSPPAPALALDHAISTGTHRKPIG